MMARAAPLRRGRPRGSRSGNPELGQSCGVAGLARVTGVKTVNANRERTVSLVRGTRVAPDAPSLRGDQSCDVVVIGAGIAGLSAAYELSCRDKQVVVIDRGPIGGGMTARTTAHLASASDDSFDALIKRRGLDLASLFYQSQAAAIDRIEQIQREEDIDCTFRRLDGFLFPAIGKDPAELD